MILRIVFIYKSTRCYNSEEQNQYLRRCENHKFHILSYFFFFIVYFKSYCSKCAWTIANRQRLTVPTKHNFPPWIHYVTELNVQKIKDENPSIPKLFINHNLSAYNILDYINRFPIIFALVPIQHCVPCCYRIPSSHAVPLFPSTTHDTSRQPDRQQWVASARTPGVWSLVPTSYTPRDRPRCDVRVAIMSYSRPSTTVPVPQL
jgi:hypothetical protein